MRTNTLLMLTACVAAAAGGALMLTPTQALALGGNECGPANTASNPQVATCTGAFNPYNNGITYNENNTPPASQGNLQVKLSGTAGVSTAGNGVSVTGVSGFGADATLLAGSSVTAGGFGVFATTSGGGTGSITNAGTVHAGTYGLLAQSSGGGLGSVTNNGSVTVTGSNA